MTENQWKETDIKQRESTKPKIDYLAWIAKLANSNKTG